MDDINLSLVLKRGKFEVADENSRTTVSIIQGKYLQISSEVTEGYLGFADSLGLKQIDIQSTIEVL